MTASSMRGPMRCLPAVRGFTLIELMLALVIMSIVIAFAGPRVAGGLMGLNIRSASKQTAAMLRYARSKAVNSGCQYHVIFDGIGRRVILVQSRPAEAEGGQPVDMDADAAGLGDQELDSREADGEEADARPAVLEKKIYPLPDGVVFESVVIADVDSATLGDEMLMMLTFYPNGTTRGASVSIADEYERRFFITVDALTGNVGIKEDFGDD